MQDIRDDNCVFCKIADGAIPSITCYEDNEFRVFCDVSPATRGHVLIIPKNHYEDFFSIPDEVAQDIFVLAKKTATALKEILGCDGINVLQNNGRAAGQTVFHYHIHLIPRYDGEEDLIYWENKEVDRPAMEHVAKQLQNLL